MVLLVEGKFILTNSILYYLTQGCLASFIQKRVVVRQKKRFRGDIWHYRIGLQKCKVDSLWKGECIGGTASTVVARVTGTRVTHVS